MSLRQDSLAALETHWAVSALPVELRERAFEVAKMQLVRNAVGHQLHIEGDIDLSDLELLKQVSFAFEMAAMEGLSAFLNHSPQQDDLRLQCVAAAWRTFELRRLLPIPPSDEERIYHTLHLASLAYCGDRWSDIRRWFSEHPSDIEVPSIAGVTWELRLIYRIFDCWIRLLRKNGWDDLDRVREIIAGLRNDQQEYEVTSLNSGSNAVDRHTALRLVALYNWAKATEVLAIYMMQGEPRGIHALLDKYFEAATDAGVAAGDSSLEILMRWLHAASRQMVSGSLWWVAHSINSRVTDFVGSVAQHQSMFELLPPQRAALQEQGLLDAAATAVVIDLPTSGGKTLLAQFRILQALNQFADRGGWIAYVVPTKALGNQVTRRLRRDFGPINVRVEQLTGALEIDAIEEDLLTSTAGGDSRAFDVLIATPEKLQLIIRNKKVRRPLSLIVMDEAHNMEDETRGLRIELLLATVKQESTATNFLLLMPFVERADALARWLANDPRAGRSISFGTSPWRPNEQVIGMFDVAEDNTVPAGWRLQFETLLTTRSTIQLSGVYDVGETKPLTLPKSRFLKSNGEQQGFNLQAAAMAAVFSTRGVSVAVGEDPAVTWTMAREVVKVIPHLGEPSPRVKLVQKYLAAEVGPNFELIEMLAHGVAVHHSGLSDEVRSLIEWLTEESEIKVLCATTTLAQGINFPVSSVFLATLNRPIARQFTYREFWNLAGRAGRMNQESVGVVGIASANRGRGIREYVKNATGELVSRLVSIVADLDAASDNEGLLRVIHEQQWEDFRCYVNHLVHELGSMESIISSLENSLRNTYGYRVLQESPQGQVRARKLIEATKLYASRISTQPGIVARADSTGFSFEGVGRAMHGIRELNRELTPADFSPARMFGDASGIADFFGIMLKIPQLGKLSEIMGSGHENRHLADVTKDWVNGLSIQDIAKAYFSDGQDATHAITDACKAIYRNLVNNGSWGISALTRLSGIDFDQLTNEQKRQINLLPAMVYHGVSSEEAVLMRMNGIPRSIAESMGKQFKETSEPMGYKKSVQGVRDFIRSADIQVWSKSRANDSPLSAEAYRDVWRVISGEAN